MSSLTTVNLSIRSLAENMQLRSCAHRTAQLFALPAHKCMHPAFLHIIEIVHDFDTAFSAVALNSNINHLHRKNEKLQHVVTA